MKKIISIIALIVVLTAIVFAVTGCTLQIETTENSVSASVDGDTTERVDSVLDWIRERIQRVFTTTSSESSSVTTTTKSTTTKI